MSRGLAAWVGTQSKRHQLVEMQKWSRLDPNEACSGILSRIRAFPAKLMRQLLLFCRFLQPVLFSIFEPFPSAAQLGLQ
jgi:hypothetical protein